MHEKARTEALWKFGGYGFVIVATMFVIIPIYWLLIASTLPQTEILSNAGSLPRLLPGANFLDNAQALAQRQNVDYYQSVLNSVFVAIVYTVLWAGIGVGLLVAPVLYPRVFDLRMRSVRQRLRERGASVREIDLPWPQPHNILFLTPRDDAAARKKKVMRAIQRWHPDKFTANFGGLLREEERDAIMTRVRGVSASVIELRQVYN